MPSSINLARLSALLNLQPDTSNRDWYSIRNEMIATIPIFNPEWTARNLSDPGITLIELTAFVLDSFHYAQDQIHRDSRFKESFSRHAVISYGEMVGYFPTLYSAANVDITYRLDTGQDSDINIPALSELQTENEPIVIFENDELLTIPGPDFVDITTLTGTTTTIRVADSSIYSVGDKIEVSQDLVLRTITSKPDSTTVEFSGDPLLTASSSGQKVRSYLSNITAVPLSVTGSASEGKTTTQSNIAVSDGTSLQEYVISLNPIIDKTLKIYWNEGAGNILWNQADNNRLINHSGSENVYELSIDGFDNITVRFGNNSSGRIPPSNAILTASARVGGGTRGNVPIDTIKTINTPISVVGTLTLTNESAASGGDDRESIDSIKENAPNNLSIFVGNIVSETDYQASAESVAGVLRAQAALNGFNIVNIYVVPSGPSGSIPSQGLLSNVENFINNNPGRLISARAKALPPNYVTIDFEGKIFLNSDASRSSLRTKIINKVLNYFNPATVNFGITNDNRTYLHISDFYGLIENIEGVDYVELTKFTRRPEFKYVRWSGNAVVGDVRVGKTSIFEIYEIVFLGPTKFVVTGTLNKTTDIGFTDQVFTTSDGGLSFVITTGSSAMTQGDSGSVITNVFRSESIELFNREFPIQGMSIGITGLIDTILIQGGVL